jgi:hypothetical protein
MDFGAHDELVLSYNTSSIRHNPVKSVAGSPVVHAGFVASAAGAEHVGIPIDKSNYYHY